MIRTCPVCHEPCDWPDTLCACCRKYATDPHHQCAATVLIERWTDAEQAFQDCACPLATTCEHEQAAQAAEENARLYVARRREAQGEASDG